MNSLKERIDHLMELRNNGAPYFEFMNLYEKTVKEMGQGKFHTIAQIFEETDRKKSKSNVYTPYLLSKELCRKAKKAIIRKDELSVLDCSVGSGNIILSFIEELYGNDESSSMNTGKVRFDITDIDEYCEKVSLIEIFRKRKDADVRSLGRNFLSLDGKYDLILGNPPYLGFKDTEPSLRELLRKEFPDIYSDKGDYYHAFFKKAHTLLNDGGILAFIVPRYFMESRSGEPLRDFILSEFRIEFIHDFYGDRPFGAGVDPCILILRKCRIKEEYSFPAIRNDVGEMTVETGTLGRNSMKLLTRKELETIKIIEKYCELPLSDFGEFRQGIITGADKVFVMREDEAIERGIEKELLVPWIKSKDIEDGRINASDLYLVYPDREEKEMPGFIKYAGKHKDILIGRREVRNGVRKYYELTWGRKKEDFSRKRILFRYKSSKSSFAFGEKIFHSADIYSFIPHNEYDIPYLLTILNSDIYDIYIKSRLKKLGRDLYEYYPHRLSEIHVPDREKFKDPEGFLEMIGKMLGR